MEVKAPCVVKLLGEHAVVHGRTAVAAALELYATVSFEETESADSLELVLKDYDKKLVLNGKLLFELAKKYKNKNSIKEYMESCSELDNAVLPYATIASNFYEKYGQFPKGSISISSEIPKRSGLASSASCYTAFTVLLLLLLKKNLSDDEIIELARDGERVSHINEGAGRIDVSTAYYGGYVSFSNKEGFIKHTFEASPKLLIVNTGPKKPTSETVGKVTELLKRRRESTEKLLDRINECSIEGLDALAENDMKKLGTLMYEDHELLKALEVSSEGLDKTVELAKKHGAYGAKLSGGGGGGVAIALLERYDKKLENVLKQEGFECMEVRISENGAMIYTKSRNTT